MDTIELKLETVTPLFLHGHNNRVLELRPPPFKSLMRYWWRTVQEHVENQLRDSEAKLFGDTSGKAPFSIRISGTENLATTQYKPLPHRTDRRGFQTDAYRTGQSFGLHLITKSNTDTQTYADIAQLSFLLGGIGNRSNRGFGSVRYSRWNFQEVSGIRQMILQMLNSVAGTRRFETNGQIIESTLSRFPDYPVVKKVYFGQPTTDVNSLLKKIGQATHDALQQNRDITLGSGNPRMSSPVVVRIQKVGRQYLPILTQLHSSYPRTAPPRFEQKQNSFIQAIIK
jgi:CRISPR-associated protein Cmr1